MSALDDARAALADAEVAERLRVTPHPTRLMRALRALIAEHERLTAELAERDADDIRRSEEGRTDWDYEQRIARLTAPPTDDEREALFEALADRLGEHPKSENHEVADSGEYETKLVGTFDVEALAEWLCPAVFSVGFRRDAS